MFTDRSRLAQLVLALYPRQVRQRYGAEIAELLNRSATPGRDLANVAWCALVERGASLSMSQARPHLLRLAGLLAAPLAFAAALGIVAGGAVAAMAVLEGMGYRIWYRLGELAIAACVVPVAAGTVWLARRIGRRANIPVPAFMVPTAIALGIVAIASLPYLGEALGEARPPMLLSSLVWYAGTLGLATAGAALVRRARD